MSVRFVVRGEKTSGLVNHAEGGRPETGPAACGVNPQAWTDSRGVRHVIVPMRNTEPVTCTRSGCR
jgi:hypothetical protein